MLGLRKREKLCRAKRDTERVQHGWEGGGEGGFVVVAFVLTLWRLTTCTPCRDAGAPGGECNTHGVEFGFFEEVILLSMAHKNRLLLSSVISRSYAFDIKPRRHVRPLIHAIKTASLPTREVQTERPCPPPLAVNIPPSRQKCAYRQRPVSSNPADETWQAGLTRRPKSRQMIQESSTNNKGPRTNIKKNAREHAGTQCR